MTEFFSSGEGVPVFILVSDRSCSPVRESGLDPCEVVVLGSELVSESGVKLVML